MIRILLSIVALSIFGNHIVHAQSGEKSMYTKEFIYVGTFSERGSLGIYVFQFNHADGTLTAIQTAPGKKSPSFLAIHPSGKYLYAVQREGIDPSKDWGSVASYKIEPNNGKLVFMNEQPSYGEDPCHVSVNPAGNLIFVSNYNGGNLAVYPIVPDGKIGKSTDLIQHEGSSVNQNRQEKAHVHSAIPSADGKFLYVSDLGTDQIFIYSIQNSGKLLPASTPFVKVKPGSGPRHLEFSPDNNFAISSEELTSTVSMYSCDHSTGALTFIQRYSSIPADFKGTNTGADVHFDPSEKFAYASNRGNNTLAIYHFNKEDGTLSDMRNASVVGDWPRNFFMDPEGQYIFVANRNSDNVIVFKRDPETGGIMFHGVEAHVPGAVCIKMLQVK